MVPGSSAYDGTGHHKRPPTGSRIGLHSLEHGQSVLDLLGLDGTRSVVVDFLVDIVNGTARRAGLGLDLLRGLLPLCAAVESGNGDIGEAR